MCLLPSSNGERQWAPRDTGLGKVDRLAGSGRSGFPFQARPSGCHFANPNEAQVWFPCIQEDHKGVGGSIIGPAALLLHAWGRPSIQCLTEHLLCPRSPGNPSPKKVIFFLRLRNGTQTQGHLASEPFPYVHLHFSPAPLPPQPLAAYNNSPSNVTGAALNSSNDWEQRAETRRAVRRQLLPTTAQWIWLHFSKCYSIAETCLLIKRLRERVTHRDPISSG